MTLSTATTKIDELLAVLDEDIRHVETTLSRLETLRGLLIKRDDVALDSLLGEIRRQAEIYAANEQARQGLRADLAEALGCEPGQLTLSKLQAALPDQRRSLVVERQARLKSLAAELKREYALTTMLVSDCARFNRSLMRAFFGLGSKGGMTYSPSGAVKPQADTSLVSLKF